MPDATLHDVMIVGGGINGCGIARDAAGRGFSVCLAEMNDLGSGTSSWSTKLIHGGLRYLEYYEFRLVREALREREVLWREAPHIVWPMRFVLPHHEGMRPAWLLRLGLFLYDHIGGRRLLDKTRTLDMRSDPAGKPLKPIFRRAFEYSDCCVDDARLVVLNARGAADRGATIHTRTAVTSARREGMHWLVGLQNLRNGKRREVRARLLVNAAGPWVDEVLASALGRNGAHNVRLVQGSHLVIRRRFEHGRAYFFQNADGRIIFAIPYENDFTLIGTTDLDYAGDPQAAEISESEIDYLLEAASEYFRDPLERHEIVWAFSGVRPLFDDGATKAQEATRDYVLKEENGAGTAPLINIFGGKLTTYRRLSEAVLERVEKHLGQKRRRWTAGASLPGGDFPTTTFDNEVGRLANEYPFLEAGHARRLFRLYGTQARQVLGEARNLDELGRCFGGDLHEAEVRYLMAREWAETAEDVLWRRSKLGLRFSKEQVAELEAFMRDAREETEVAA